jgi:hypothetical protein
VGTHAFQLIIKRCNEVSDGTAAGPNLHRITDRVVIWLALKLPVALYLGSERFKGARQGIHEKYISLMQGGVLWGGLTARRIELVA